MKSYFRILSALSAVAAVIAFSGCGGKEQEQPKPDPVKVSGVSIDKPTLSMTEGETANLTAIVMPENATNKAVAWKSGNSGVADVDASGKVTAVKAGTSDITVTTADGGKTATCKVTVASKAVPATGLTLSLSSVAFVEGQTKSINATVTPSNSTDEVVWPSPAQLTSNGGGSYTAKKADDSESFDLEVKAGAASAKAGVTVYPMWFVDTASDKLVPDGSTSTITEGGELTCYFSKKNSGIKGSDYIGDDILPAGDFTVSSSEAGIATVEKVVVSSKYNGFKVVGKKLGSSTITVKIGDVSRSIKVTVTEKTVPATGLTLAPKSLEFVEGQTKSFGATVTPSNTTDEVVWPSSSYLTSNGGGSYTANKLGFDNYVGFDLDVKAGSVKAKAGVMVYPMWFVHYSKNKYELVPDGSTYKLDKDENIACYFSKKKSYATHEDRIDRDILSEGDFTVTSSDNSVATVRKSTVGAGGRIYHGFDVSALNVGSSTITVKIGNVSRSFKVTVTEKTVPATGLDVTPRNLTFVEGQTKSFSAAVTPSNSTDNVVWPNSSYLTSKGGGTYTANKLGFDNYVGFELDVKAGSVTKKAGVTVYPMWFARLNGNKYEFVPNGSTYKLDKNIRMTCYFSKKNFDITDDHIIDNRILPKGDFTVTSSNNSVATVRKETMGVGEWNGFSVSALNAGRSTITVKIGSVSRSFDVLVQVPATGITLNPTSLFFVEGQTKSFSAAVTPSNSTDNVVWPNSSYLTSKGGGTYTANKLGFDNYVGFELDVKAGSVTKKAGVTVYPMWFARLNGNKYEFVPNGSTYKLDKNIRMTCYFSKKNFDITDDHIIDNRILPKGDFTVTSSNNSVATVRKETMGVGEWNGFSVSALNAGRSTITVKIGSVSRSFDVLVQVPATGITLNPTSLFFVEGQTKSFSATVTPSNSTDEVVWSNHFLFENKGGGTYAANQVTKIRKEQITVKAGSVSVKADVTVCPMYFFDFYTKKSHYDTSTSSDNVVIKKGQKAFLCFSKTGKYKSKADLVERSVLSPTEIRLHYDKNLFNAKVVTYDNKYVGFEIEALNKDHYLQDYIQFFDVRIGKVEKHFNVRVKK